MSKSEITMRMLSAEARVGLNSIRSGQLSDDEWSKLARRMGEISDAPLFIDDSAKPFNDGDPRKGPPPKAAPRSQTDCYRLPTVDVIR